ncbi:hypothetical protein CWO84_15480 [Methylomonas sp. Kb3]|uniref:hypothetical protein n=1 Tax=Methylomonas sp. Kb3 TaxID=1611544 RepID=UPI000C32ECC0|nr:hypothetical protein [Methylomonas sp. Kb3]PKD39129.1 hypothetical protein CWO84_15480 [Methylomonas sp. Kb3]
MDLPWESLEIAKLGVSLVTPVLVLILGIIINNSIKTSERATALRSEIYKTVGGDLNDIYSYLAFVGCWKEMTPLEIIAKKRAVDKAMYTYKPFFSNELFHTYETFMEEAFAPYGGSGKDARIRSDISTADGDRQSHSKEWEVEWGDRFTKERNKLAQDQAYNRFLEQLARDLALK